MAELPVAGGPAIKIAGEWRPQGKGPHDDVEVRVAYSLINAPTLARFLSHVDLTELRVSVLADGYRLMLKGTRGEKHMVAFFHERTWRDVIVQCVTTLDSARVKWWPDEYPPAV